ncbi:MAG: hypothetical protein DRR19_16960 [Candidatus Parabeggiatoa sp. nov. 1]|nr:MAG: hypothetical protein DRR19_16960 [Gammaproteobacteria bacterium]
MATPEPENIGKKAKIGFIRLYPKSVALDVIGIFTVNELNYPRNLSTWVDSTIPHSFFSQIRCTYIIGNGK